jgi:two-component sensor histidine kinase
VHHLRDSYNGRQRVQFRLQIDSLELNVAQSVPIALILNEAITNSIKYAFPASDSANTNTIRIDMKAGAGKQVHLVIADNGTGLPADFHSTTTLGLRLMKGLTEDLNGTFDIRNDNGTIITISFVAVPQLYDNAQYTETEPLAQHG